MSWTKVAGGEKPTDVSFKVTVSESYADTFEAMLDYIRKSASSGHTFSILVDPNSEGEQSFEIDGDGSDHIRSVERV